MTTLFLDTSFLIALESKDDQYHATAMKYWQEFGANPAAIVTTTYILDETVTYFNSRGHHKKAVEIGSFLMKSAAVHIVHVDEALFEKGWQYFKRHNDKRYSLTDSISFVVMRQLKIKSALSFDKHFTQAGFIRLP